MICCTDADVGIRYQVNEHLQPRLQSTNMITAPQRMLMGGYPGQKFYAPCWFKSDRRVSRGANLAF